MQSVFCYGERQEQDVRIGARHEQEKNNVPHGKLPVTVLRL